MTDPMKKFILGILLFVTDGAAMFLFKRWPSFFFPAYRMFSKKWIAFLSSLSSMFPFAVWDILMVLCVIVLIVTLISSFRKHSFLKWLSNVFLIASISVFIVVCGWMLNHYAPELSEELDLEVGEYSTDQLYEACDHYLRMASEHSVFIGRDEEGHIRDYDFEEIAAIAGSSYEKLSETYPVFEGSKVRIKGLSVAGEYLMYNGIVGIFMPVTGEAGVPYSVPDAPMPFTMAHEAGHRLGLAGEEEANFAAFLACVHSPDERFIYSGYYNAFSYCFSSLYKADPEKALELYHKHDESRGTIMLKIDRQDTSAVYKRYESPLKEVSDQINDTYLKTFDEEQGIQSYGMVTDYLIAWYLARR